jgi:small nuclear ribonucleoprotein (snRNP)-like protein
MVDNGFLAQFLNKKVVIHQKDNFIKNGILRGYDDRFIYLDFVRGNTKTAIAKDMIISISEDKYE